MKGKAKKRAAAKRAGKKPTAVNQAAAERAAEERAAIPAANLTNITGVAMDDSGQPLAYAEWRAIPIPIQPNSRVFFVDGTPAPPSFTGTLDATGAFSGTIGLTSRMSPPGFYAITFTTATSAPPITVPGVRITGSPSTDLGAVLNGRIPTIRITAAPLVYAYNADEIVGPFVGCGYVNTASDPPQQFFFRDGAWVAVSGDVAALDQANVFTANQNLNGVGVGDRQGAIDNPAMPWVAADSGSLMFNAGATKTLFINWDHGSEVWIGNGAGALICSIDNTGNAHFTGMVTADGGFSPPAAARGKKKIAGDGATAERMRQATRAKPGKRKPR